MGKKVTNSQLSLVKIYNLKVRELLALAENVLVFHNLPMSVSNINKKLVKNGSIAFIVDDVMGLLAVDYEPLEWLNNDENEKVTKISVNLNNGYNRFIEEKDFTIMYDNLSRRSIYIDILQYSERLARIEKTVDINVDQQKTPRFWKTSNERVRTVKDMINEVDSFENIVVGYDDMDFDDTQIVLQPAPYITDKLDDHKDKIYNEFLAKIGIASLTVQKKERNIRDEIKASLGGCIANRYSRFTARKEAVDEINLKFKKYLKNPIEVEFYDGMPTTLEDKEDNNNVSD